ncbi:hypothetical protein LTR86_009827 [Recurvomyces mirabilis]|nr:hypothetical protein LTR86_009827 [Recurvomyces mirabilis]
MDPLSAIGLVLVLSRLATDVSAILHNGTHHTYPGASNEVAGLAREVDSLSAALRTLSATVNEESGSDSVCPSPDRMAEIKRLLQEIRSQFESIEMLLATSGKDHRSGPVFARDLQDATRRLQTCCYVDRLRRLCKPQEPVERMLDPAFATRASPERFFVVGQVKLQTPRYLYAANRWQVLEVMWTNSDEKAPNLVAPSLKQLSNERTLGREAGRNLDTASRIRGDGSGAYGFSKVRRFVVIQAGDRYCSALPIKTYNGLGVNVAPVARSHHAIIYSGTTERSNEVDIPGRQASHSATSDRTRTGLGANEQGMISRSITISCTNTAQLSHCLNPSGPDAMVAGPIRVATNGGSERLDETSRLDFGRTHTVHSRIDYGLEKLSGSGASHFVFATTMQSDLSKQAMESGYVLDTKDNPYGEKTLYKRLGNSSDGAIGHQPPAFGMEIMPCHGRGCTICWRPYVRTIVKAAMVLLMPPLLLSVHNYTIRNILDGHSIVGLADSSSYRGQDDTQHRFIALISSFVEKPILDPSPLVFFCCAISAAALMRIYGHLNRNDRFQIWFVLTGILFGLAVGVFGGYDLLASALCVMPWSVFFALLVSDVLHHGLRAIRPSWKLVEVMCSNGCGCAHDDHRLESPGESGRTHTGGAEV